MLTKTENRVIKWLRDTGYLCLSLILTFSAATLHAGQGHVDSLVQVIRAFPDDTAKVNFTNRHWFDILDTDYDLGYNLATDMLTLSERLGYRIGQAHSLGNIGTYYWYNGYYDEAEKAFKKALSLASGSGDDHFLAETHNRLGLVFYYQARHDSAQAYHKRALHHFRQDGDSLGVARIWYHIGLLHFHQSQYDQAVGHYLKALNLYETGRVPLSQARMLNELGKVYMELGQTQLIWEKQKALVALVNQEANTSNYAQFNEHLADIYYLTNSFDSAFTCYQKALHGYQQMGHINFYDFSNEKSGQILLKMGQYEAAEEYLLRVLEIRQVQGTRIHQSSIHVNLGDLYFAWGKWGEATKYYQQALHMHLEMGNAISIAKVHTALAKTYSESGDHQLAIHHAKKGLETAEKIGAQNTQIDNLKILSQIFKVKGERSQSLHYQELYFEKNEALTKGKALQTISHLQVRYNEEKNQRKIAELKQKETLQNARLQRQNLLVTIFLILLVFILIVSLLLYNRYQLKARNNKLLAQRNREIEADNVLLNKKNKEGELLLAEIRHRIKNNLQTLSSLLSMQSRRLSNRQRHLIQESHDRVRAMTLIHQKLHKDTRYAYVQLDSYLDELTQNLLISYGYPELKPHLDISSLSVEADSAVYIGLITNELISNALKHAYHGTTSPTLAIGIERTGENNLCIIVKDNGIGFGQEHTNGESFGIRLISVLVEELEGKLEFRQVDGTEAVVSLQCHVLEPLPELQDA